MSLVQSKFNSTRKELSSSLIEREQEIDLILTALIAQEHVLLVGPPGTGKSMLANAVVNWMHGQQFSLLVTKYTAPEEVFGPISVAGLKADEYRRIVAGKLPEADVAFIDEIFKASSAILNTTLQILNERTFRNNGHLLNCPLKLCIGASNEWPGDQEGGKELGALFDRFLFRKLVRPIGSEKSLNRLLWDDTLSPSVTTAITPVEIAQATLEADGLPWSLEAKQAMHDILRQAKAEGIVPGDRRMRKSIRAARAFAWLNGQVAVQPDDLEILGHVLWDDPTEQPKTLAKIVGEIANPTGMKINQLLMEAQEIIGKLDLKKLADCATACKKLSEIAKSVEKMPGSRAAQAFDYVRDEVKRIKKASVENM